jgi:signal transduction histidine kinase/CheY-like chemotaxis protein
MANHPSLEGATAHAVLCITGNREIDEFPDRIFSFSLVHALGVLLFIEKRAKITSVYYARPRGLGEIDALARRGENNRRRSVAAREDMKQTYSDPGTLVDTFNLEVLQSAKPMAIGLVLIYSSFVGIGLLQPSGAPQILTPLIEGVMVGLASLFVIALQRGLIRPKWASPFVSIAISLTFLNGFVAVLVTGKIYGLQFSPYLIIACGALLLSTRWLVVTLIPVFAMSLSLSYGMFSPAALFELSLHFIVATVLCIALHLARKQTLLRLYELRRQDALAKTKLKVALDHSEKVIEDHTRTENERRMLEEQLHQTQKIEAVGVLAGGIAHGMNNLLGTISANASLIREETSPLDPRRREIDDILSAAKRGGELTRNLLGFARKGKFQKTIVDLNQGIRQTAEMLRETLPKHLRVDIDLSPELPPIFGDPSQIGQILMNLCLNAADAMAERGRLTIASRTVTVPEEGTPNPVLSHPGQYCVIRVSDTGKGMTGEVVEHAFEPFYTTKPPDRGTGLGLAMVYGAVRSHGGVVTIDSAVGEGTVVTVFLPVATNEEIALESVKRASSIPPPPPKEETRKVLLVDDEPMIRSSGKRILKYLGCDVLLACNGAEAVDVVEKDGTGIDLVILDIAMPVMDGTECFYKLRDIDPQLPIIISSGFADEAHTERLIADGASGLLPKPYDMNQMVELIQSPGPRGRQAKGVGSLR